MGFIRLKQCEFPGCTNEFPEHYWSDVCGAHDSTNKRKENMQLPDIELVCAKVHEAWMESKRRNGVNSRKAEDGEELMVPYDQLSEKAKDLDRGSVKAVYDAIAAAGA